MDDEEARDVGLFDKLMHLGEGRQVKRLEAIANQVIEGHTELRWRNGRWQEWLPAAGFCSALGDDPAEFWEVVAANRIEANDQGHPSGTSAREIY